MGPRLRRLNLRRLRARGVAAASPAGRPRGEPAVRDGAARERGRRRSAYKAPHGSVASRPVSSGAESKRRRCPRSHARQSRVTLLALASAGACAYNPHMGCVFRPNRTPIPGEAEHPFRAKPNTQTGKANTPERSDAGALYFAGFVPFVKPFRIDSPVSLIRWAPCTSRSQIASATVSSPMTGCQSLGSS